MKLSELRKQFDDICESFKDKDSSFFFVNEGKVLGIKPKYVMIPHLLPAKTMQDTFCYEEQSGIYQLNISLKRDSLELYAFDDFIDLIMDKFREHKYVEVPYRTRGVADEQYYNVAISIPYRF